MKAEEKAKEKTENSKKKIIKKKVK